MTKDVAIIGAGASGCMCAYFLLKNNFNVKIFDYGTPLRTLLPTGGGRCNLAHNEYDFKELTKNYPRGEKFLYSVFSRFGTYDTIEVFNELGISTYTQDDGRIFPESNSSRDVRNKILNSIKKADFIDEKITEISPIGKDYKIKSTKAEYLFSKIVIAIGGGKSIKGLNHNIIPFTPSLVGLNTNIKNLSGVVLKNIYSYDYCIVDDLLFTHFGISGPITYKISSIKSKDKFPYNLSFDMYYNQELKLQELLNKNPHKEFKNIIGSIFPQRFADYITAEYGKIKAHEISSDIRNKISDKIHNFKINVSGANIGEEVVTAGGYDLKEINASSMESKIYPDLYIIGEALDIDGFCGGYNLQNAWSTAYVAAQSIIKKSYI